MIKSYFNNIIVCPSCRVVLDEKDNYFVCSRCNKQFSINEEIPTFITTQGTYVDTNDELMDKILSEMKDEKWQKVVYENVATKNPWLYQIITDHTRVDYLFLHDLKNDDLVLDVGSGWGQTAFALTKRVGSVVAIDNNFRRVKFILRRSQQEKIDSVVPIQADILNLPFKEELFDFVSMIGVLEWVAIDRLDEDPHSLQLQALKEVYRVLKKGKSVCIGIENSNAWAYKLGKPDDHTGIKHISYLAREKANQLSRKVTGKDYRTHTYTKDGYSELLRSAGFTEKNISFYYPIPSYKEPSYIIPLESKKSLQYFYSHLSGNHDPDSLEEKVREAEEKSVSDDNYHQKVSSYFIFAKK